MNQTTFINVNPSAYVKIKTAVDEIKNLEVEHEKILEEYEGYLESFEKEIQVIQQ